MKKYTTLLLSAMLLIGITGSAFAEEKQAQKSFEDTVKEYNFEDN